MNVGQPNNKDPMGCEAYSRPLFRLAILTRKVGQTELVLLWGGTLLAQSLTLLLHFQLPSSFLPCPLPSFTQQGPE